MTWPTHFPAQCPPANAATPNGVVYHFVFQTPPLASDFVSMWIKSGGKGITDRTKCKSCGLSVFTELADMDKARRQVPAFRTAHVAKGTLDSSHGKIMSTPSRTGKSHHTWWVPDSVVPESIFEILEPKAEPQK